MHAWEEVFTATVARFPPGNPEISKCCCSSRLFQEHRGLLHCQVFLLPRKLGCFHTTLLSAAWPEQQCLFWDDSFTPTVLLSVLLTNLRSLCLPGLGSCRGRKVLWLLLRHPMIGEGGRAAPRVVASPSTSSTREEVELPMVLLDQVKRP